MLSYCSPFWKDNVFLGLAAIGISPNKYYQLPQKKSVLMIPFNMFLTCMMLYEELNSYT